MELIKFQNNIKNGDKKVKTLLQIIKEHIQYRKQIIKLAKSDLIKTYRGAALRMGMGNNKTND